MWFPGGRSRKRGRSAFPVHALPVPTADFQISFAIFSCEAFLSSKARTETIPAKSVHVHRFYALWFNRKFGRRGHFWGDRFKNPELMGLEAVQDRILYVELNAVRAGMVKRPEQWKWGTARWRLTGNDQDLIPLDELFPADPGTDVYRGYRTRLYYRGAVPNRDNQVAIPRWILHQEQRHGYTRAGAFRRGLRFLKDGLAVGAAEETDHPREVAEAALAHKVRNPIEAACRRTDLFERRRLMDDWADYLDQLKAVST